VFLVGGEYARLTQLTGHASVLIPLGDQAQLAGDDAADARRGLEIAASAGTGGFELAAGFSEIASGGQSPLFFGFDLRGKVGRFGSGGSSPHSTYVGADAGYTFMHIRGSLGVAYRVTGGPGHSRWMFAPSIGIVIPLARGW
jgi:hypothetical protein